MTCFVRLFLLDLRKGVALQWKRYIVCFLAMLGFAALAAMQWAQWGGGTGPVSPMSFGDLLVSTFAGRDFFYAGDGEPFSLPYKWLLVVLLEAYLTLDYPLDDLNGTGLAGVAMGGSRTAWWLAKCCWVVASVVAFCVCAVVACAVVALCTGGPMSMDMSPSIPAFLTITGTLTETPWNCVKFLVVVPVVLCALCLVQLLMTLLFNTLPSFMVTTVCVFLAAYGNHELLLGEYLMAARSSVFVADVGYSPEIGLLLALVLCVWAVVHSTLLFRKIDVYSRGCA